VTLTLVIGSASRDCRLRRARFASLTIMAGRASSAPPRGQEEEGAEGAPKDVEATTGQGLSHSNGAGADSPTAWREVGLIREHLLMVAFWFQPRVEVSVWRGYLYAWVRMCPWRPPLAILRPQKMHVTLLRAYPSPHGPGLQAFNGLLPTWNIALQSICEAMLQPVQRHGYVKGMLELPPFKYSWTFGPPQVVQCILEPCCRCLENLVLSVDPAATFGERIASHISWD
jgi:hypothetical protein